MEIRKIRFTRHTNETGSLAFLESVRDIPFSIKRVYYIFDVAKGAHRGFHAHKKLQQVLICIRGSCKVLVDDGVEKPLWNSTTRQKDCMSEMPYGVKCLNFRPGQCFWSLLPNISMNRTISGTIRSFYPT